MRRALVLSNTPLLPLGAFAQLGLDDYMGPEHHWG